MQRSSKSFKVLECKAVFSNAGKKSSTRFAKPDEMPIIDFRRSSERLEKRLTARIKQEGGAERIISSISVRNSQTPLYTSRATSG